MNETEEIIDMERYYNSYREMFNTEGWGNLCNELRTNVQNINSVEATKNETELNFRKGQLSVLGTILNLESQIKSMEEQYFDEAGN